MCAEHIKAIGSRYSFPKFFSHIQSTNYVTQLDYNSNFLVIFMLSQGFAVFDDHMVALDGASNKPLS